MYSEIECNEKLNAGSLQACTPGSLMATGPSASLGRLSMGVSLNNKLAIKKLIHGAFYILMYSDIECNEKLNAAGSLQASIAGSLMVRCPSAPSAPLGMSISLDNKLAIKELEGACYILMYRDGQYHSWLTHSFLFFNFK
jgi:hypothetical protein